MEIKKYLLLPFLLFLPLFAGDHPDLCIESSKDDFIKICVHKEPDPLIVGGLVEISAMVSKADFEEILKGYPNPPNINQVEPCFYLYYDDKDFNTFSGKVGDCDLFDNKGVAQRKWILEVIRHGSGKKIYIGLGWKYIDSSETHQISSKKERVVLVDVKIGNSWLENIFSSWSNISILIISLTALGLSVVGLQTRYKCLFCIIISIFIICVIFLIYFWINK